MTTSMNKHLSIVIPVYGSINSLSELVDRIETNVLSITDSYEIVLIDDCGPGEAWLKIQDLARKNKNIKAAKLSRNFGQHYAISAGLELSEAEWIVVMDCDLQDQPEEISRLYDEAQKGYDIVLAKRAVRRDGFLKRLGSKLFYSLLSYLTDIEYNEQIGNFGIYNNKVIKAINELKEKIRYFPTMVKWVGYSSTAIEVKHSARKEGESGYNLNKLLNLAIDIILSNSDKPLRLTVKLGLLICSSSIIFTIITIVRYCMGEIWVLGYFSTILSIWLLSGIIIFILGIVALYIGKTFEGVKNRPIYIIDKTINID